ncbi:uncharacterized protein LOC105430487 [Pogonomyrmex barbatus]|uniref:Uncharacterized protein LOC105430487 n=1 Tax=Pogonomyrmex barbatus TaxID=144034 RepID=A0A6I9WLD8_9HYME|nr:uncharacterized protein LOC105430487 [Pogonomyrmex barbatus]
MLKWMKEYGSIFINRYIINTQQFFKKHSKDIEFSSVEENESAELLCNNISSDEPKELLHDYFSELPVEVILKILKYLDLKSLYRMCRVNKYFNDLAQNPMLYTSFRLHSYELHCYKNVTGKDLLKLLETSRYKYLKKVEIDNTDRFSSWEVLSLILTYGSSLTCLYLCFTEDINIDNITSTISIKCKNLKELKISRCGKHITEKGFLCLANLQFLEYFALSQSYITTTTLCKIVRNNRRLRHLAITYSFSNIDLVDVFKKLKKYCPNLEIVDFHGYVNISTMRYFDQLSECKNLREVNFNSRYTRIYKTEDSASFRHFLSSCQYLEKICLRRYKGFTDHDLKALTLCKNLKYLDLMGIQTLTANTCHSIFKHCPKLEFINLTFCNNISDSFIKQWQEEHSHVTIRRMDEKDQLEDIFFPFDLVTNIRFYGI